MLNFNLKKKYLSAIFKKTVRKKIPAIVFKILDNYSPKEISPKKLSELELCISGEIKNNDLIITIELQQKYDFDWQYLSTELEKKLKKSTKFKKINIIISYHLPSEKKSVPLKKSAKTTTYKLILVCSAKGGVGKSTICVNLALAMQKLGKKTAIVDSDIYGPSTHHLLGISASSPRVEDGLMIPYENYGIKLNSMGLIAPKDKALIWRGPMLGKSLNNLLASTEWGDTEYLFVDLPPGTGDVYLTLLQQYQYAKAVLISTPQKISLIDVSRSLDLLKKLNIETLGIIENMALGKNDAMSQNVLNFSKQHEMEYLGRIQYDTKISYYSDMSIPAVTQEGLNCTGELEKIAQKLYQKF